MKNKGISREQLEKDTKSSIEFYKTCVKCERCGHSLPIGRQNKILCKYCGNYIFKNKKEEFIYRMGNII